jgi:hypothetical protein
LLQVGLVLPVRLELPVEAPVEPSLPLFEGACPQAINTGARAAARTSNNRDRALRMTSLLVQRPLMVILRKP